MNRSDRKELFYTRETPEGKDFRPKQNFYVFGEMVEKKGLERSPNLANHRLQHAPVFPVMSVGQRIPLAQQSG